MEEAKFKIEGAFMLSRFGAVVVCECLTPGFNFELKGRCFLDNIELLNNVIMVTPRDKQGNIRLNVHSIRLKNNSDLVYFTAGQVLTFKCITNEA